MDTLDATMSLEAAGAAFDEHRPTGSSGGLEGLLRTARLRCDAAVAFSALRGEDGTFSIAADPDPLGRAPDLFPAWNLFVLREMVQEAWVDPMLSQHSCVVRRTRGPLEPATLCRAEVLLTAVPLRELSGNGRTAVGLLGVAAPSGHGVDKRTIPVLAELADRVSAYLSSRRNVFADTVRITALEVAAEDGATTPAASMTTSSTTAVAVADDVTTSGQRRGALSRLAIRGGAYLVAREGIGMLIRLAGVVITVRLIGPSAYGIYSAAAAFVAVVALFAQMGVEVYLIRSAAEPDRATYNQAFTFLLCTSTVATLGLLAATFVFGAWLRPVGVALPLRILVLTLPINVLWAPAQARIERRFQYRRMGILELGGDVALYGTAVPLAALHFGPWSLVAASFAWQGWLLAGSLAMSGLRPRWSWSCSTMKALARHGFAYSAASAMPRVTGVINAVVVGSFVGAAGVGLVAFAQNLVTTLGFAARGAYRLGLVAMSKVPDHQRERLRYAIEEGTVLQLLALAVPYAAFAVAARWVVPAVFGPQWVQATPLYCLLALTAMLNAPQLIQATLMFSRGENLRVALATFIGSAGLAIAAVLLVSRYGIVGFGLASLLTMVGTVYTDRVIRRLTPFGYKRFASAFVITAPALLFPLLPGPYGFAVLAPLLALVAIAPVRRETLRMVRLVRSATGGSAP